MRRFLLVLTTVLLLIILVIVISIQNKPKNLLPEIQPQLSVVVSIGKATQSNCQGKLPQVDLPKSSLSADQLALIVNDNDAQSVAVANYYQQKRNIPSGNVIHVSFQAGMNEIDPHIFKAIQLKIDAVITPKTQAIALSFSRPFKVGCMSITSALSFGYDEEFCQQKRKLNNCRYPQISPYYASYSIAPFTDFGIRPSMMLAGQDTAQVIQMINRGIKSDGTFPRAVGYLQVTSDRTRSVRAQEFSDLAKNWSVNSGWTLKYLDNSAGKITSDFIIEKNNILFYFTGLPRVPLIEANSYLPGAIADHLTSSGGVLFNSPQMSILSWLKAGATASYGAVVEPCNFVAKFSDPRILVSNYYRGQTAIEAYWKSVASPYEGVFVGEPLAKPMGVKRSLSSERLSLKLSTLEPGKTYQVYSASTPERPYSPASELITLQNYQVIEINFSCEPLYYKFIEVQSP